MFKVELENGTVITWDSGKFESNNQKVLDKLREYGKKLSKRGLGVYLSGTCIGAGNGVDYEKNRFTAYALIATTGKIKSVDGDVPTIEELYGTPKENEIN